MAHPRKFRFGVQFATAKSRDEWRQKVRLTEELGYDTVCLSDHFLDVLAPLPALMAAAEATSRVRLGTCLLDNDFRHPAVLAKEIATLDLLSEGRVELGIGAGWLKSDYDESGVAYESAKVRIDKLEESLRVLKGLFADAPLTFEGTHYQVRLNGTPKPVQKPHPPFFIGGGGRRMLGVAAREADIVGVNFNLGAGTYSPAMGADATPAATEEKVRWVREAAGARFDDLELHVLVFAPFVTPAREQVAQVVAPHFGADKGTVLQMPYALIGTVDEICDMLERRREQHGFSYYTIGEDAIRAFAPVVARMTGR